MDDLHRFARALAAMRPALDELVEASERLRGLGFIGDVAEINNYVILLEARTFRAMAMALGPPPITTPLETEIAAGVSAAPPLPGGGYVSPPGPADSDERRDFERAVLSRLKECTTVAELAGALTRYGLVCESIAGVLYVGKGGAVELVRGNGCWTPRAGDMGHDDIARRLVGVAMGGEP